MSVEAMVWVLDWSQTRGATFQVAFALANYARKDGTDARPSLSTLARASRVSRPTVPGCLQELERLGEIERTGKWKSGTIIYRFPKLNGGQPRRPVSRGDQSAEATEVVSRGDSASQPRRPDPSRTVHDPSKTHVGSAEQVRAVFDHWKAAMGRNGHTKLTDDRRRKIKARLDEGYTVEQLQAVADAVRKSPWHMGDNPRRRPYNDFATIFRNAQQVDGFLEQAKAGPAKPEDDGW